MRNLYTSLLGGLYIFQVTCVIVFCFNRFYIILNGSVSIYLDSKQDDKEKQSDNNPNASLPHHLPPLPEKRTGWEDKEDDDDDIRTAALRGAANRRRMSILWRPRRVVEDDAERRKLGVVVNTLGNR